MTLDELRAAVGRVEREVFRLEVQQSYAGVSDPGWDAWQAGRPLPQRTVENNEWLAQVASHVSAGLRRYRALVLDLPLTEYLRYELVAFAHNVAAGEEVFLVLSDADPRLSDLTEDFWMLDERLVGIMRYDEHRRFTEVVEPSEPAETYITRRDLALQHALPLHTLDGETSGTAGALTTPAWCAPGRSRG